MHKVKKILFLVLCFGIILSCWSVTLGLLKCSWKTDVANYNILKEEDKFNVYRRITIINTQSDKTMLEFEGWCSVYVDNRDNLLELTYRVGENQYSKDFIGLNDRITYVITQIDGSNIDKYHYEWLYHSDVYLTPIGLKDNDKK